MVSPNVVLVLVDDMGALRHRLRHRHARRLLAHACKAECAGIKGDPAMSRLLNVNLGTVEAPATTATAVRVATRAAP
jgi:hypothetical protein